ncbi:hypothetical protein [Bifidobacterium sp. UBA744]|uniref:hypothetical protein n=1 Tax=Bifidobacterium sp. UBA744 TaxID=1946112 RepID=UPI0025C60CB3|nr:hypothetical protein [Bifidobacterium sp. UBA744]
MSASTTESTLRACGRVGGFDVYYNPLNRRMICERESDLAAALFDFPSCTLVHNWGVSEQVLSQLRRWLQSEAQLRMSNE